MHVFWQALEAGLRGAPWEGAVPRFAILRLSICEPLPGPHQEQARNNHFMPNPIVGPSHLCWFLSWLLFYQQTLEFRGSINPRPFPPLGNSCESEPLTCMSSLTVIS